MTISYRRFSSGDFKIILRCLLCVFYFITIPYTLFMAREFSFLGHIHGTISWVIYSFMIVGALCFIATSLKLNKFSKVFGFGKPEEKFIKAFISGVKKGEKRK